MSDLGSGALQPMKNPARAAWALYLIVFVSGAVLMGLEIAGAKMLAPSFGTSTFVWGAIIGMFMGALAAGYYVGGGLADRRPSFKMLTIIVSIAAVWIVLLPRFGPGTAEAIARIDLGRTIGPLLACLVLFFIPSFLMGMVSPYSVKLNASSLAGVGGVAGRLYALSTFGSIVGTLLTTFMLIPYMNLSNVLQWLGIILLSFAVIGLGMFHSAIGSVTRSQVNAIAVLALFWLAGVESWAALPVKPSVYPGNRLIHYEDSPYHEILVTEEVVRYDESKDPDGGTILPSKTWYWEDDRRNVVLPDGSFPQIRRWLKFNENIESGTFPYHRTHRNAVTYTDLLHLPLIWVNQPKRMLVVGGGGGILPSQYNNWYKTNVDVAEIDGAVARIAKQYFDMPPGTDTADGGIKFYIGDGRQLVRRQLEGPYDIIVLDAYSSGGQIPFHLMTWEFLNEVKSKLAPNGILVTNIISGLQNGQAAEMSHNADLFLAEYKTLSATREEARKAKMGVKSDKPEDNVPLFKNLYVFPKFYDEDARLQEGVLEEYRNVIVIATNEAERRTAESLEKAADELSLKLEDLKSETNREEVLEKAKVKCDLRPHIIAYKKLRDRGVPSREIIESEKLPIMTDDYAPVDLMYRPVKRDENTRRVR